MLLASVKVHVFLYGLIAIAPAKDHKSATVVVMEADQHQAFVAYDANCLTGRCLDKVVLYRDNPRGVPLTGHQVTLSGVTDVAGSGSLTFNGENDKRDIGSLPTTETEAAYFRWVPRFPDFQVKGAIDNGCLSDSFPSTCGQGKALIAGRMRLAAGTISTCRLRKYKQHVYPIQFSADTVLTQALAEIVVLDATVDADYLVLTVGSYSVTLAPAELTNEIRVWIGNQPPETMNGDSDEKAEHFKHLHSLLSAPPSKLTAISVDKRKYTDLQPLCNDGDLVPTDLGIKSVLSRPICPMASFAVQ